jgi:hypothetical protein
VVTTSIDASPKFRFTLSAAVDSLSAYKTLIINLLTHYWFRGRPKGLKGATH